MAFLPSVTGLQVVGLFFAYVATTVIYRRFFHPLAKIPGPFLACVTSLYGFYFNGVKGGVFYLEIERLHRIYGPVVRIAPNEIHLSDRANYDIIYSIGSKFIKDVAFYAALGDKNSIFATGSNELHRKRRAPLNSFFSRRTVLELEDLVQEKALKLCRVVQEGIDKKVPVDLYSGFRAISIDVVTDYAFDDCWNQLDRDDLGAWFSEFVKSTGAVLWVFQQVPLLQKILSALPPEISRKLNPDVAQMLDIRMRSTGIVRKVQERISKGVKPKRSSIFYELLDPELNTDKDLPSTELMADEAFDFLTAASDTAGNAMTVATHHVITNPQIYEQVKRELHDRFPDPNAKLDFAELEKLPFLTAVIKEGLRLSYGLVSRLPRVTPPGGATFNGYFVPEGTVVGMTAYLMHRDEEIFPDPATFDPKRWLNGPPEVIKMREKSLVPFSRGRRMCIGQNLAMCEIYVAVGTLLHRFGDLRASYVGPLTYMDGFVIHQSDDSQKLKVTGPV